ncbi:CTP synthase [Candidatus Xenohaliotis californiensis]|uniref:CTP synthase n=1 Tax=Candidatus Xenohaliotis californiensis TaxID=84677 RepID=A0ABM9N7I0_9RICK|nr:CTP synthase [Candidatus Xenohaliotis californiensis]
MSNFIFVTGGVVSSLGKGIAAAGLAMLLGRCGFKIRVRKFDPYFNVDSGTMSPGEHGEVFVTNDGTEADLDIGHYERFTGCNANNKDSITMGKVFAELLMRERRGDFLGKTIQVVPHVTNIIKEFIQNDSNDFDFIICEIGGTVGDIEALSFLEAIRQLNYELGVGKTMHIHTTLVPHLSTTSELKTKPTQHSVKELRSIGIQPNMLLCRSETVLSSKELNKISLMCSLPPEMVISAPNVSNVYEVPLVYHEAGFDKVVMEHFGLLGCSPNLLDWHRFVDSINNPVHTIKVALVGKYTKFGDAYRSVIEALNHGGVIHLTKVEIVMVDAKKLAADGVVSALDEVDAVVIPGGFGYEGVEGIISAIKYSRENNIPTLGICLGMQLAVIEFARNVIGWNDAISSEFSSSGCMVVGLMEEWIGADAKMEKRSSSDDKGGTMRLGSYSCDINRNSKMFEIYKQELIDERHRHRFEINVQYMSTFEQHGMIFSGTSAHGSVLEALEIKSHPWFIATQFHPELKSKILDPHPLFVSLVEMALQHSKNIRTL